MSNESRTLDLMVPMIEISLLFQALHRGGKVGGKQEAGDVGIMKFLVMEYPGPCIHTTSSPLGVGPRNSRKSIHIYPGL